MLSLYYLCVACKMLGLTVDAVPDLRGEHFGPFEHVTKLLLNNGLQTAETISLVRFGAILLVWLE